MPPGGSHTTIVVHGFELKLLEAGFNGAGGVKSLMAISGLSKTDCLGLTRNGGWPILIFCVDFAAYILGTKEPAQLCNLMHVWVSIVVYIFPTPLCPTFHPFVRSHDTTSATIKVYLCVRDML